MTDCCTGFSTTTTSAERSGNALFRALDDCGDKAIYLGVVGTQYADMMPVKFGAAPNTVEPALDGVDAIGFVNGDPLASAKNPMLSVTRTGHVKWADVAPAVGESPTDAAAWWAIHQEMAKANVYVEFN